MDFRRPVAAQSPHQPGSHPARSFIEIVREAFTAPAAEARKTFIAVVVLEIVCATLSNLLSGLGALRNAAMLVSVLGIAVIGYLLVSCLKEVATSGTDGFSAGVHSWAPDAFVGMAISVIGLPLTVFLILTWQAGWTPPVDAHSLSTNQLVLVLVAGAVWSLTLPMALILGMVRGLPNTALNPFKLALAVWQGGWSYLRTWLASGLVMLAAVVGGYLVHGLPLIGAYLANILLLYGLVASAWTFGVWCWLESPAQE